MTKFLNLGFLIDLEYIYIYYVYVCEWLEVKTANVWFVQSFQA